MWSLKLVKRMFIPLNFVIFIKIQQNLIQKYEKLSWTLAKWDYLT